MPPAELPIHPLLWLGALWVVPTGLRRAGATYRLVSLVALFAVAASFWPPAAAVWLGGTLYVALIGLGRWQRWRQLEELSISVGMLYLPVGGFWWLASRGGWQPLGFSKVIVALTAVHFHFAGFGAPLLSGLLGRHLRAHRPDLWGRYRTTAIGIMLAPLLVALGITWSRSLEALGAWLLAGSLLGQAVLLLATTRSGWLKASALSVAVSMGLAAFYAWGRLRGWESVSIEVMIQTHGVVNALGFVGCGLVGWGREEFASSREAMQARGGSSP